MTGSSATRRVLISLMITLLFMGTMFVSVSSTPAGASVVAMVRVAGEGTTARDQDTGMLEDLGADIIVDYPDAVLARVPEGAVAGLEASGHSVSPLVDPTVIELQAARFDTRDGEPALPDGTTVTYGPNDMGYFIVQFIGPIKEEWRMEVEAHGAAVISYIPNLAYIVRMRGAVADEIAGLSFVGWVGPYHPAYKVSPDLREWVGVIPVRVLMFEGESELPAVEQVLALGGDIGLTGGEINRLAVVGIDVRDLSSVARVPGVMWMEYYTDPALIVDDVVFPTQTAAWIVQTNITNNRKIYTQGINGTGQVIANADTGIVVTHWAFHDSAQTVKYANPTTSPNDLPNMNHRKVIHYWTFGNNVDGDFSNHGTHTAGINAGDNKPNGGDGSNNGIAFGAKISFQDVSNNMNPSYPADMNTLYGVAYNDTARVHSGSMVCPGGGAYTTDSMQIDQFIHNNQDFLAVIANHNYGPGLSTVCDKASAKNSLSMGAGENGPNQDSMVDAGSSDYSGRGPTVDGRLKPTVVTPTNVISPGGTSTNDYGSFGGTSSSTPVAAGTVVLIRQYFYDGFYPSGVKTPTNGFNASGALMKAISINGADEMNGPKTHSHNYNSMPYPTNDQGWGRMNLDNALYFLGDDRKLFIEDNSSGISTGEMFEYAVSVINTDQPLEVTLVWSDYWGNPGGSGKMIVNDLDLEVTSPSGTSYKGNVFSTGSVHESVSGGSIDRTNVEENFLLKVPEAGVYSINVSGFNVPQGPQPFALVATGNFTSMPDLRVDKKDITLNATSPVEGDTVLVNATAKVFGTDGLVPCPAKLFIDGTEVATWDLDILLKDNKYSYPWTAVAGFHDIKAIVDPANIVVEASETNNMANRTFYINGIPKPVLEVTPLTINTSESVTANASRSTDDGNVSLYLINWGDGTAPNWVPTPVQTHIYKENGEYNVTLRIKDNASYESELTAPVKVTVLNRHPVPNLTAFPTTVQTLINVTFDASKTKDPDGNFTLKWDFGDGNTSANKTTAHSYSNNGVYKVTLTVTDNDGDVERAYANITVTNRDPTSMFGVKLKDGDPNASAMDGNVTTVFEFNGVASDLDGSIAEYVWDFGDGTTSDEEAPIHNYSDDGVYEVSFYVIDDDGVKSEARFWNLTIYNLAPEAVAEMSAGSVETFDDVTFTDMSTDMDGQIVSWSWDLGDGESANTKEVTHNYTEDGTYTVTLDISDDDGEHAGAILTVKVLNRFPIAAGECNITAYVGDEVRCYANGTYDMDGTITKYSWFHNETTSAEGANVSFTFGAPGNYEFILTVMDNDGDVATYGLKVNITDRPVPPPDDKKTSGMAGLSPMLVIVLVLIIVIVLVALVALMTRGRKKRPAYVEKVATVRPGQGADGYVPYDQVQGTGGGRMPEYGPPVTSNPYGPPADQTPEYPVVEEQPPVAPEETVATEEATVTSDEGAGVKEEEEETGTVAQAVEEDEGLLMKETEEAEEEIPMATAKAIKK